MAKEKISILLIEDNDADAKLLQRTLGAAHLPAWEVHHAMDLRSGIRALKGKSFDAVLLDLNLPDSSGTETISKLREAIPNVPIIVLTGLDTPKAILDSIKIGAQDYFIKSRLTVDNITEKILEIVGRGRGQSEGNISKETATQRIRVLVVEDNDADVALLRRMLSSVKLAEFEIAQASTLADARKQLHKGTDVVLLDLGLPDSQGIETLQRLRAEDLQTPIIILTGSNDRKLAVTALENRAQDYLVKGTADGVLIGRSILRQLKLTEAKSE